MSSRIWACAATAGMLFFAYSISPVWADGWNPASKATNKNSVVNSRHDLTMLYSPGVATMNVTRSQYGEVCVYCHTPHGASGAVAAPLWNRTKSAGPFTLYSKATMLERPITNPGPNSLTCLSCHDGVTGMDSIINMPGSGLYSAAQETSVNAAFLNTWPSPGWHIGMQSCVNGCHGSELPWGSGDFSAFVLGNDLRNDHPVGIEYPVAFGPGVDFNPPTDAVAGKASYFDVNANNRLDVAEVRMYDTGDGYEVECGSCHDPHGVESAGPGSDFIPSFLRVANGPNFGGSPSGLCLTCHVK